MWLRFYLDMKQQTDSFICIFIVLSVEGRKKIDLLAEHSAVCIETDILEKYVKTEHGVTADYKIVIDRIAGKRTF